MNRLSSVKKRTWEESYNALLAYKERHGNCLVPCHNHPDDPALGGWVNHQRSKKAKLSEEQRQKLDRVGFAWCLRERNKNWNAMMEALQNFKRAHGHLNVAQAHHQADPNIKKLAAFVEEQRTKYRKGQLSAARLKQLEDMGLVVKVEEAEEEDKDDSSVESQQKAEEQQVEEESGREQTECVGEEAYQSEEEDDCEQEDENMIRFDKNFKLQYQKLVDFHIKFGHCRVPKFSRRGETLGLWVAALRRKYAGNPDKGLEARCHELLDELDFFTGITLLPAQLKSASDTDGDESGSTRGESEEEDDAEQEDTEEDSDGGDSDTSGREKSEDEREENSSQEEEQGSKAESKASSSHRTAQQSEGGDDSNGKENRSEPKGQRLSVSSSNARYRDDRFMKQFNDLLDFKREHGHCRVPQSKKFKTLGGWVNNLRVTYNRDPLNGVRPDRKKMLDEVGFTWNAAAERPGYNERWEVQYKHLLEFRDKFGHCRVPQTDSHKKLGRWVATQRALYVKDPVNGIRPDRLKRLKDIEFTWDAKGFKGKHLSDTIDQEPTSRAKGESSGAESDEEGGHQEAVSWANDASSFQAARITPTADYVLSLQIPQQVAGFFPMNGNFGPAMTPLQLALLFPRTSVNSRFFASSEAALAFPQTTGSNATVAISEATVVGPETTASSTFTA